jgi:hypothetical protein
MLSMILVLAHRAVATVVLIASILINGTWVSITTPPAVIIAAVSPDYTNAKPWVLHVREGESAKSLGVLTDPSNFTISRGDCRLVLSTYKKPLGGVYVQITDLQDGQLNATYLASEMFQNAEIEKFLYPAFGPDDRKFAIIGQDDERKYLYVFDGTGSVDLVYSWPETNMIYGIRWMASGSLVIRYVGPQSEEIEYWQIDRNEVGAYTRQPIARSQYYSLDPSDTEYWDTTMTPGVSKALACTPYKG